MYCWQTMGLLMALANPVFNTLFYWSTQTTHIIGQFYYNNNNNNNLYPPFSILFEFSFYLSYSNVVINIILSSILLFRFFFFTQRSTVLYLILPSDFLPPPLVAGKQYEFKIDSMWQFNHLITVLLRHLRPVASRSWELKTSKTKKQTV